MLIVPIIQAQCHKIITIPNLIALTIPPLCTDSQAFENMQYEDFTIMEYENLGIMEYEA